jgi:hypothetical protein
MLRRNVESADVMTRVRVHECGTVQLRRGRGQGRGTAYQTSLSLFIFIRYVLLR